MYNYITGKVVYSAGNTIVVDNNGIGYEIGASNFTTNKFSEGEIAKIYTYLYVREDTYALYGFSSIEEKTLFLRLIDISGVGPKMAMQILSGADLNSLTVAIATGDVKSLSKIKGLGKKTAELIVVSMRDQVSLDLTNAQSEISAVVEKDAQEAVFALVSLGISNSDAVKIVADVSKTEKGAETLVRIWKELSVNLTENFRTTGLFRQSRPSTISKKTLFVRSRYPNTSGKAR